MEGAPDETNYPKGLDKIRGKYNIIFQELPRGLPLERLRDHIIDLIPQSSLVMRECYKHSHKHKT